MLTNEKPALNHDELLGNPGLGALGFLARGIIRIVVIAALPPLIKGDSAADSVETAAFPIKRCPATRMGDEILWARATYRYPFTLSCDMRAIGRRGGCLSQRPDARDVARLAGSPGESLPESGRLPLGGIACNDDKGRPPSISLPGLEGKRKFS